MSIIFRSRRTPVATIGSLNVEINQRSPPESGDSVRSRISYRAGATRRSGESMNASTPAEQPAPLTHREILFVFSGLMLGMLLAALDQTIVATALPTMVGELGGLTHLSWVITAYLLTSTASVPLYGKLSDL
ncbi:MAG: hypothetical protein R2849_15720 [Thermomicrobiales bacterium]